MTDKLRDAALWKLLTEAREALWQPANPDLCGRIDEALAQQDAQAVPQGWKLVPVEPTEAMCEEGLEDEGHTIRDGKAFAGALYRAMLNAAPTPPAQRVMLTDDEIESIRVDKEFTEWGISEPVFLRVARAVIEAYERKNGIK